MDTFQGLADIPTLPSFKKLRPHNMVIWPAIIKHADDAELVYVSNQSEWDDDADLHHASYDESDVLIDSSGRTFSLTQLPDQSVTPEPKAVSISLHDILGLIKAHAAVKGSCCVAKLYAPSITDAFKIVESLDQS